MLSGNLPKANSTVERNSDGERVKFGEHSIKWVRGLRVEPQGKEFVEKKKMLCCLGR